MVVVGAAVPTKASYSVCSAVLPLMLALPDPYASHTKLLKSRFCTHVHKGHAVAHGLAGGRNYPHLMLLVLMCQTRVCMGLQTLVCIKTDGKCTCSRQACHKLSALMSCMNDATETLIL